MASRLSGSSASSPRSSTSSLTSPRSIHDPHPLDNVSLPSSPGDVDEGYYRSFAFPPAPALSAKPVAETHDIDSQLKAFTFGTCPSVPAPGASAFVGTPTAELGPFEYPAFPGSGLSPPPTRRSSTTSTIFTLPAAGRRPSVLHSSTAPPDALPVVLDADDLDAEAIPTPAPAPSRRRQSIMFSHRTPATPGPIPPSLLQLERRRGSLPVSKLFPQSQFQDAHGYTTTTVDLYARRNSSISSAGSSSKTATPGGAGSAGRRNSLLSSSPSTSGGVPPQSYFALRRQSVPHNLPSSSLPPVRRSSGSSSSSSSIGSLSLQQRRALRSSVSASVPNPFVSSGSEDDSVEEDDEREMEKERPPLETINSDGSTPRGSAETTTTVAGIRREEGELPVGVDEKTVRAKVGLNEPL